jgi:signal peptidase II
MNVTRAIGLAVAALVFVIDQLAKLYVVATLGVDQKLVAALLQSKTSIDLYSREIVSIFDLRFVPNIGVSLGLLPADENWVRWALVLLTAVIAGGVLWWMMRERKLPDVIALGMVLGGALGNILDRVRFGYVVDFADLHFGTWRPFLVFNVADAAISIGVAILLIRALFVREKTKAAPNSGPDPVEKNVNA